MIRMAIGVLYKRNKYEFEYYSIRRSCLLPSLAEILRTCSGVLGFALKIETVHACTKLSGVIYFRMKKIQHSLFPLSFSTASRIVCVYLVYHVMFITHDEDHFDTRRDYGDCFGSRATYGECKQTAYCRPSKQKIGAQVRIDLNRVKGERSVNSSYFNLLLLSGLSKERDFNLYGSNIVALKWHCSYSVYNCTSTYIPIHLYLESFHCTK